MNRLTEKTKPNMLLTFACANMLILGGCAGGGGGGSDAGPTTAMDTNSHTVASDTPTSPTPQDDSPTVETVPAESDTPQNDAEENSIMVSSTSELESSTEFAFSTSYNLPVSIDVSEMAEVPELLVICKEFDFDGERFDIRYNDCILKTDLVDGVYSGSLKLTNDTRMLVAALWYYNAGKEPLTVAWSYTDQPEGFTIR
ncbi:MAG: hypothetical protein AAF542_17155 [Pseudomonadota bacterium]